MKKTKSIKFKPGGSDGISKAWILPNGEIHQLGGQWHHAWLADNADVQTRYSLAIPPFTGTDSELVRESALKKGFVRVNYSRNRGALTIEARQKDWRKHKPAIEKLVDANVSEIDSIVVSLLNETCDKVVASDSARLFELDDFEKLQNIPFVTKDC